MKKLLILMLMIGTLFSGVRELTDENFEKATTRGLVAVEFYATWNEANKVTAIDEWDSFDAKVYRLNIDTYPKIQADNEVVILPTIIFFDDGEEVHRLQGDMTFTLKTTTDELDEVVEEILGNKF
jgi:thioredoxin-like negative regulator of GroEL